MPNAKEISWQSHGRVWKEKESGYLLTEQWQQSSTREFCCSIESRCKCKEPFLAGPSESSPVLRNLYESKLCPQLTCWLMSWSIGLNLDPLCRRCDDIYSENPSWQAWWFYGLACLTGSWLGHQGDGVVEAVPIDRIYWLFIFRVRQK